MNSVWNTYYIYYYDSSKQDEVIELIAKKMASFMEENIIEKWFFIRYWEGGPHIRVRFLTEKTLNYKEVFKEVIDYITINPFKGNLRKEEYYENIKENTISKEELPWYEEGEIIAAEYIPEYERYGGEELMPLTESLFMISSEYVTRLISITKAKGFLLRFFFSAATVKFLVDKLQEKELLGVTSNVFYENCVRCWRGINSIEDMSYAENLLNNCVSNGKCIESINELILDREFFSNSLENLIKGFEEIYSKVKDYKSFRSIVFSHLHMLNNRLGIVPEYECALYYCIKEGGVL